MLYRHTHTYTFYICMHYYIMYFLGYISCGPLSSSPKQLIQQFGSPVGGIKNTQIVSNFLLQLPSLAHSSGIS